MISRRKNWLANRLVSTAGKIYLFFGGVGYIINIQSKTGELVVQAERK